jgi:HK97 family phage major capsid protein
MTYTYTPAPHSPDTQFEQFRAAVRADWEPRSLDECSARRAELTGRVEVLGGYANLSQVQRAEFEDCTAGVVVLDELVGEKLTARRSEQIARGMEAMRDPANCEGSVPGQQAPALVKGLGDRAETATEIMQRSGNPWAVRSDPLAGHTSYGRTDTGAGLIARAHSALEALEGTAPGALPREGAERLAQAFADSAGWPGMTIKRSRDEQAEAAELFLCLSNPLYHEAFRNVLRWPSEFTSGGTGFETFTDEQRQAWREVRTNTLVRAAFAETSGAVGAYALPLQLDPNIMITNAGVVGPFRKLARTVIGTSNVWEGLTSQGTTANWTAEGAVTADTTPSLSQVAITPAKSAVWCFGSLEVTGDTQLDDQVPGLIAEARSRLELTSFTTGSGSGQPYGVITRGASDTALGALTAAMVYGLHVNLPPRFRSYDSARPAWIANVSIMDALRQIPAFTGAVNPILADQTSDGIPEVLGIDIYEASAMDAVNGTGTHKNLCLGDFSQMILVDRLPAVMIFENLLLDASTARPTGQVGWYSYARTGADITTPAAAYGSNSFVYHTG